MGRQEDAVLDALYAVADEQDAVIIDELSVRAGLAWRCPDDPSWTMQMGERCGGCQRFSVETARPR
jgi:hypothetical protein